MSEMKLIHQAACSVDPVGGLKRVVRELSGKRHSKDAIYQFFQGALLAARAAHRGEESPEENAILEIMDLLSGFCDPDLVLLPDRLDNSPHPGAP